MRKRRRQSVPANEHRVLLSEVLPFELPASLGNVGLFNRILDIGLKRGEDGRFWVRRSDDGTKLLLRMILGEGVDVIPSTLDERGRFLVSAAVEKKRYTQTAPFKFSIRHRDGSRRELSVAHPRSQLDVVDFYNRFSGLLLHHAGRGSFSLRRPAGVAKVGVYRDWLFVTSAGDYPEIRDAERHGASDMAVRSFFTYDRYTNIHQFYDSSEYRLNERKYGYLVKADITKCFDSIYTHSVAWAANGLELVKAQLRIKRDTESFGASFDSLLQAQNRDETSGILIGSEYSRLFAEVILQRVDEEVEAKLSRAGLASGRDYEILRYVDDYFIFLANRDFEPIVVEALESRLRVYKLHLNASKRQAAETPWLSPLSVAKERLRALIDIGPLARPHASALPWRISAEGLIAGYKRVLIDTDAEPPDLANYALSRIERAVERLIGSADWFIGGATDESEEAPWERQGLVDDAILAFVEFAFFVFGGVRRASPGIKLARIVTSTASMYNRNGVAFDRRHRVFAFMRDELLMQMGRFGSVDKGGVEQVLLLDCLTYLAPDKPLQESELVRLLGVQDEASVSLLNAVSIIRHIGSRPNFDAVRGSIEEWVLSVARGPSRDAEGSLVALAFVNSPFIRTQVRAALVQRYGGSVTSLKPDAVLGQEFLVDWVGFDLYGVLQSKRMFEVY